MGSARKRRLAGWTGLPNLSDSVLSTVHRAYVPTSESWLACRRCWGLTYVSKTLYNSKNSLWRLGPFARIIATTQREWALGATEERRGQGREGSREHWEERRTGTL